MKAKKKELYTKTTGTLPLVYKAGAAQADLWEIPNILLSVQQRPYTQIFYGETVDGLFKDLRTIFG